MVVRPYLPVAILSIGVALGVILLDRQQAGILMERQRLATMEDLSRLRLRLQGEVDSDIQLVRGLVSALEEDPEMTVSAFTTRARRLLAHSGSVRTVVVAPGLKVSMVYPQAAADSLMGRDLRSLLGQGESAVAALTARDVVIAGPVVLGQGGRGLLLRYPVSVQGANGRPHRWGIVSASIDLDALIARGGLTLSQHDFDFALSADAPSDGMPEVFFGSPGVLDEQPVQQRLERMGWTLSAAPRGGWAAPDGALRDFRALLSIVALLIIAPMAWAGWLLGQRKRSIAELLRREADLVAASRRLQLAIESSGMQIWQRDAVTGESISDPAFGPPGGPAGAEGGGTWGPEILPEDRAVLRARFHEAVRTGQPFSAEYRMRGPDGALRHLRSYGRTYADPGARPVMIGADWEVTSFVRLNESLREASRQAQTRAQLLEVARDRLEYNANHDATTGLPNRNHLETLFETLDADAADAGPLSVIIIDLHRFKDINDTLGYHGGNEILRRTGTVLSEAARPQDVVARVGGDEFVVVTRQHTFPEDPDNPARRMLDALTRPFLHGAHEYRVGATVGAAARSHRREKSTSVFLNADIALHAARQRGRNHIEYFTDTLRAEAVDTKRMADDVLRGLERREFIPVYQLQFDARTLEVTGAEALVRWQHPRQGLLTPFRFLEVAEMLNVMGDLDAMVLEQALADFRGWAAQGLRVPRISVNVSAQRLGDDMLAERISRLDFEPGTLAFELVETISFDDASQQIADNIQRIRALGIDIEIDDFGTGYASILSLLNLSPRFLKIDKDLVLPVVGSARSRKLVSSVVEIGRALGIGVIAEGVESARHAEILRDLGCQILQGYALARPMPAEDLPAFIRARAWQPGATGEA
ncbi:EAL domain-containing protein (plasmid) [Paroceanicella profunda]|uniref:EAL domain-containing protein n=1 Tax=Paroceanicella profunda TaxID=2579971 RepID=A0A5B8FZU0_9RHOB|nr:EAL domain-containing protein [Paroceanicella profunda]QDL94436.1 EAL domain-containing protein [Paroceanicella profunda]